MIALIVIVLYMFFMGLVRKWSIKFLDDESSMWFGVFWPITVPYILGSNFITIIQKINMKNVFKKGESDDVSKI